MAYLTDVDRKRIWRGLMRYWSQIQETTGNFDKNDLRNAITATDEWIDDNQADYNAALPNPFKQEAAQGQKVLLFCAVASARVNPGMATLLRKLFGEVE